MSCRVSLRAMKKLFQSQNPGLASLVSKSTRNPGLASLVSKSTRRFSSSTPSNPAEQPAEQPSIKSILLSKFKGLSSSLFNPKNVKEWASQMDERIFADRHHKWVSLGSGYITIFSGIASCGIIIAWISDFNSHGIYLESLLLVKKFELILAGYSFKIAKEVVAAYEKAEKDEAEKEKEEETQSKAAENNANKDEKKEGDGEKGEDDQKKNSCESHEKTDGENEKADQREEEA